MTFTVDPLKSRHLRCPCGLEKKENITTGTTRNVVVRRRAAKLLCSLPVVERSAVQLPSCSCPHKHIQNKSLSLYSAANNCLFSLFLYCYLNPSTHSFIYIETILEQDTDSRFLSFFFFLLHTKPFYNHSGITQDFFFLNFHSIQVSLYCVIKCYLNFKTKSESITLWHPKVGAGCYHHWW